MTKVRHRFLNHLINPETEILVIGTFNPDVDKNTANFFYGRQKNYLWKLIPEAFNEPSLKGNSKDEKLIFIKKYKIDFIDLISEVEVDNVDNYNDSYIDDKVTEWRNVVDEIKKLQNLKRICLTRKSFGDIPNIKKRMEEIKNYCEKSKIPFEALLTPSRYHDQKKQTVWTNFFQNDNR